MQKSSKELIKFQIGIKSKLRVTRKVCHELKVWHNLCQSKYSNWKLPLEKGKFPKRILNWEWAILIKMNASLFELLWRDHKTLLKMLIERVKLDRQRSWAEKPVSKTLSVSLNAWNFKARWVVCRTRFFCRCDHWKHWLLMTSFFDLPQVCSGSPRFWKLRFLFRWTSECGRNSGYTSE